MGKDLVTLFKNLRHAFFLSGFHYSLSLWKHIGHWAGGLSWTICTIIPIMATLSASQIPSYNSYLYICLKEVLHAKFYLVKRPNLHFILSKSKSDSTTEMVLIFENVLSWQSWFSLTKKRAKTQLPKTILCRIANVHCVSENLMVIYKDFQKLNLTRCIKKGGNGRKRE